MLGMIIHLSFYLDLLLFLNYRLYLDIWSETHKVLFHKVISEVIFQGWRFSYLHYYKCMRLNEWDFLTSGK